MTIVRTIVDESNKLKTPFGTTAEIAVTEPGISKFGLVSGEGGWIVLKVPENIDQKSPEYKKFLLDSAFKGCIAAMKLVQNGIATNWVGGTFDSKTVDARFPGFKIACTIGFGIDSEKKKFADFLIKLFSMMRLLRR